ncbi:uncharacterized protein KY384_005067 [Bacidia gigantensis]|uniref:uncharacterized protein n=1 Tax=Bacidia gigantensis TaxID=2732470 RepID=UPI001D036F89|nr:uncharacterized protein KY384_005067 [Bacidia gigantensis]KAG8530564.1 hypothetical protein KY384_005067 [Bacidia gigantensis]
MSNHPPLAAASLSGAFSTRTSANSPSAMQNRSAAINRPLAGSSTVPQFGNIPAHTASTAAGPQSSTQIPFRGLDTPECLICYESFLDGKEAPLTLHCGHTVGSRCIAKWLNKTEDGDKTSRTCPSCRGEAYRVIPRQKDEAIENAALYQKVEGEVFPTFDAALSALIASKMFNLDSTQIASTYKLLNEQYLDCIVSAIDNYLEKASDEADTETSAISGKPGGPYHGFRNAVKQHMLRSSFTRRPRYEEELTLAIEKAIYSCRRSESPISKRIEMARFIISNRGRFDPREADGKVDLRDAAGATPRLRLVLSRGFYHYPLWRPDVENLIAVDSIIPQKLSNPTVRQDVDNDPSQPSFVKPFVKRTLESWGITDVEVK